MAGIKRLDAEVEKLNRQLNERISDANDSKARLERTNADAFLDAKAVREELIRALHSAEPHPIPLDQITSLHSAIRRVIEKHLNERMAIYFIWKSVKKTGQNKS